MVTIVKWNFGRNLRMCRLFSTAGLFLTVQLIAFQLGQITARFIAAGAVKAENIQQRAGRPLADVSENLNWHDDALPISLEENDAAVVDDEVPEFTMSPFLEKAYSMDPSKSSITEKTNVEGKIESALPNLIQFNRHNLPIHEADLPNVGIKTTTPENILETTEHVKAKKFTKEKAINDSNVIKSHSSVTVKTTHSEESSAPCSWMMLNTFLLVWSIISTVHWLWFCGNKLFGFMHQYDVNKQSNKSGNQNPSKLLQQRAKMIKLLQQQQTSNNNYYASKKNSNSNSSATEPSSGYSTANEQKRRPKRSHASKPIKQHQPQQHRTVIKIPSRDSLIIKQKSQRRRKRSHAGNNNNNRKFVHYENKHIPNVNPDVNDIRPKRSNKHLMFF